MRNIKISSPNKTMKFRIRLLILICIVFSFSVILIRLFFLQIINYEFYSNKAFQQHINDKNFNPKRGTIYDRNFTELAVSANIHKLVVNPHKVKKNQIPLILQFLNNEFFLDKKEMSSKIRKDKNYVVLYRGIEKSNSDKIYSFIKINKIVGIHLESDARRYYPLRTFGSHILGFTGHDGQGLEGIEAIYDKILAGIPGHFILKANGSSVKLPFKFEKFVPPQDGYGLLLTIDQYMQYYLEKHLEKARIDHKSLNGIAGVILDIKTGEILAMSTKPDFDLNQPFIIPDTHIKNKSLSKTVSLQKMWRNKVVQDTYEPGSTFKLFTTSVALDDNRINLENKFMCYGYKIIRDRRINCWKTTGHGLQNLTETVENSCNPAMIEIGQKIGKKLFRQYFEEYGLKYRSGIDLPGEGLSIFHTFRTFGNIELATSSFGQSFQLTPINVLSMISSIVNDGYLIKPHVVKGVLDSYGNIKDIVRPQIIRQVISQDTSRKMRKIMQSVVDKGTGRKAYVPGFRIGGKTATSEKLPRGQQKYIASFVGVAPMNNPSIAVLVVIDEPQGKLTGGGSIAAPIVGNIMRDVLLYLKMPIILTDEEKKMQNIETPNFIGLTKSEFKNDNLNFKYQFIGPSQIITDQIPSPGVKIPLNSLITLYMGINKPLDKVVVPDLKYKKVSEIKEILSAKKLFFKINGLSPNHVNNITCVISQQPKKDSIVPIGTTLVLEVSDTIII